MLDFFQKIKKESGDVTVLVLIFVLMTLGVMYFSNLNRIALNSLELQKKSEELLKLRQIRASLQNVVQCADTVSYLNYTCESGAAVPIRAKIGETSFSLITPPTVSGTETVYSKLFNVEIYVTCDATGGDMNFSFFVRMNPKDRGFKNLYLSDLQSAPCYSG